MKIKVAAVAVPFETKNQKLSLFHFISFHFTSQRQHLSLFFTIVQYQLFVYQTCFR